MDALANVVFERTPQAASVINLSDEQVPRQLRTLLLAIDGRSPVAQYVPLLTTLAPLPEKFVELERLGYLKRKESMRPKETQPLDQTVRSGAALQPPAPTAISSPGIASSAERTPISEKQLHDLAQQMGSLMVLPDNAFQPIAMSTQAPGLGKPAISPALKGMLRDMQDFLARQAGLEGLPLVLMFEQITSLQQLRTELPAYAELISSYGAPARAHVKQIKDRLDQALA